MHSIKEKVSNAASSGKARVDIYKAKAEEKVEQAAAVTEEEKQIAHERRKAKEAEAKMELHQAKAEHAAGKLRAKQSHALCCGVGGQHHHHRHDPSLIGTRAQPVVGTQGHLHQQQPVGTTGAVPAGTAAPTYPLGGNPPPPPRHNKLV